MKLKAIGLGLVVFLLSSFAFYWVMYAVLVYVWSLKSFYGCDEKAIAESGARPA